MPFIDVRTSAELTAGQEAEIKAELGKAISLIPGKSEGSLMVQFTDNCRLWFGGDKNETTVFVNVMLYGSAAGGSYQSFSNAVVPMLEDKLSAAHVYLKFEEVPNWFWN